LPRRADFFVLERPVWPLVRNSFIGGNYPFRERALSNAPIMPAQHFFNCGERAMIQAVHKRFQPSDHRVSFVQLDTSKAELLRQFIKDVGGLENARRALDALAELQRKTS
jgi:hypothetical protein